MASVLSECVPLILLAEQRTMLTVIMSILCRFAVLIAKVHRSYF